MLMGKSNNLLDLKVKILSSFLKIDKGMYYLLLKICYLNYTAPEGALIVKLVSPFFFYTMTSLSFLEESNN